MVHFESKFDAKLNGFFGPFKQKMKGVEVLNQSGLNKIFEAFGHMKVFFDITNEVLHTFEKLRVEVKERRAREVTNSFSNSKFCVKKDQGKL
jgi:hypothetical protein